MSRVKTYNLKPGELFRRKLKTIKYPLKRRPFKGRRRRWLNNYKIPPLTGFQKTKIVRLKYVDTVTLDAAGGAVSPSTFYINSNSLYDPQHNVGGHQPLGHDQWSTVYNKYTVLSCRMTVQALPTENSLDQTKNPGMFGIIRTQDTIFQYPSTNAVIESKQGGNARVFGPGGTLTAGSNPRISMNQSMKKHFGKKNVSDPEYAGLTGDLGVGSNPENKAYMALWVGNVAGNDPQRYVFQIKLEFIALYTDPKYLPQS